LPDRPPDANTRRSPGRRSSSSRRRSPGSASHWHTLDIASVVAPFRSSPALLSEVRSRQHQRKPTAFGVGEGSVANSLAPVC
jgi:hypothetical protein